ncbi:hypothetical protein ACC810_38660, partial [Rhizobium ruizarguesonis]
RREGREEERGREKKGKEGKKGGREEEERREGKGKGREKGRGGRRKEKRATEAAVRSAGWVHREEDGNKGWAGRSAGGEKTR